jgi:flagellar biosynthesis/type III secretory pathway protein FliH
MPQFMPGADVEPAPGFTLQDLDVLMQAAYARGRQAGYDEGHSTGLERGQRIGAEQRQKEVQEIVNRELNWTYRSFGELPVDRLSSARKARFNDLVTKLGREIMKLEGRA